MAEYKLKLLRLNSGSVEVATAEFFRFICPSCGNARNRGRLESRPLSSSDPKHLPILVLAPDYTSWSGKTGLQLRKHGDVLLLTDNFSKPYRVRVFLFNPPPEPKVIVFTKKHPQVWVLDYDEYPGGKKIPIFPPELVEAWKCDETCRSFWLWSNHSPLYPLPYEERQVVCRSCREKTITPLGVDE